MRYVSLFSGVEAASVAWEGLGWEPLCFAEIDAFPSAVLAYRFPGVENVGDVTEVDWKKKRGECDLVVGGSPCQSFSVAGKREGLKGESGLMFEYIRAVRELRPGWFLWENVPGALSSEGGEAFRQLLSEMDELGYGMAWRVLDAQFFGVPQRRRRLFLVGRLGVEPPVEVLIEPESMRGDLVPSREKRQELTARASGGAGSCGFGYKVSKGAGSIGYGEEIAPTLLSGRNDAAALVPVAFAQNTRDEVRLVNGDGSLSGALAAQPGMKQTTCVCETANTKSNGLGVSESDVMKTLDTNNSGAVAYRACTQYGDKVAGSAPIVSSGYVVRRLTPRECERLQGFPDDWTLIPYRGKPAEECPDGPRYKAMGNSMAVPVMRWIGERIAKAAEA